MNGFSNKAKIVALEMPEVRIFEAGILLLLFFFCDNYGWNIESLVQECNSYSLKPSLKFCLDTHLSGPGILPLEFINLRRSNTGT